MFGTSDRFCAAFLVVAAGGILACTPSCAANPPTGAVSRATTAAVAARPDANGQDAKPAAGMLRYPAISATHICFSYANDLWLVPREGGVASPLASPPGLETLPKFSPDGKTLAFVGNYDGNRDIYTLPVVGGIPHRVTHHPAGESLCGWTPPDTDGKANLLFLTNGFQGIGRQQRLFTVAPEGGLPQPMPMPYAGFGSISDDGKTVAFTTLSIDTRTWKRYRGGMAPDVWILDLPTGTSKKITDWEGTDTLPMWHGRSVYYLSDNGPEHRLNIWAYDTSTSQRKQVTKFADDDVRWPSMGPGVNGDGEIVFQLGSELSLLDLKSGESKAVSVTVPGARQTIRPRTVDAGKNISGYDLSPTGKRVLIEGRGDLWSAPAKEGVVRNLTRTDDAAERDGAWSPDGRWIAYFSDASGEYELYVRPSDGKPPEAKKDDKKGEAKGDVKKPDEKAGDNSEDKKDDAKPDTKADSKPDADANHAQIPPRKLTSLGVGFRFNPVWSPDNKHISFTDQAGNLFLCDVASGETKLVDTDPWGGRPDANWSHDSNWMTYTRADDVAEQGSIWIYNVKTGVKTRVTDPMFSSGSPVFDRAGDFLYFTSNRAVANPAYSDIDNSFIYAGTEQLFAVPLRKDVKSPWATKSDEEEFKKDADKKDGDKKDADKKDESKKDEAKKDDGADAKKPDDKSADKKGDDAKDKKDKKDKDLKIDLEGFEHRALIVPVPAGNFGRIAVNNEGKLVYVRQPGRGGGAEVSIKIFDPKDDKKEEKNVVVGAGGFALSADGKKLAIRKGEGIIIHETVADGGKPQTVATRGMMTTIDPRTEWKQIFDDAWRFYRDWFYEPTMHGNDWQKIGKHYKDMIDDATTREDVNWIIAEMISELNIGHAYVTGPGDVEDSPNVSVGLLGCDFNLDAAAKAYKIGTIYEGGPWDADARGPLSQPGVDVKEGEYLLAVDGQPLDPNEDPWSAFLGKAGKPTTITINAAPTMDGKQREYLVTPVGNEGDLRYRAWIEMNRAYVAKKSEGKVGYIHVPDTGANGQNNLFRQFQGQRRMQGLIIDERWNGGGQIPTRFIELLNRPVTNYWARRHAKDEVWPPDAHHGPKAMLINGQAGSGGDAFPYYFKQSKIGKLIGRRTWGGLVGISGMPPLVDGGAVSVPEFAFFKKDGNWGVEGHGVDPDIDVIDDPGKMLHGEDPQLDVAIGEVLKELKERPFVAPKRPASPDRRGMGIPPEQR